MRGAKDVHAEHHARRAHLVAVGMVAQTTSPLAAATNATATATVSEARAVRGRRANRNGDMVVVVLAGAVGGAIGDGCVNGAGGLGASRHGGEADGDAGQTQRHERQRNEQQHSAAATAAAASALEQARARQQ